MDKEMRAGRQGSNTPRSNRVKRIKIFIVISVIVLLILPTVLCIIMFFKLNFLQKQIDILMVDRYGVTYSGKNSTSNELIAQAETYNSSMKTEQSKTESDQTRISDKVNGKKMTNLEENTKSDYNKKETDTKVSKESNKKDQTGKSNGKSQNTDKSLKTADTLKSDKPDAKTQKSQENEFKDFDKKTVYLTFDDGPSKYTEEILKLLSAYQVKATFFVIGKTDTYSKKMYKEILKDGHTLGMHSYSHDYNKIYKSLEDFDKDFTKIRDLLYDTTGYLSTIYRFPGGSSNSVMKEDVSVFINYLNQKSVVYFDWNVVSGDATGVEYTPQELYESVINGIKVHNRSIVLMHDTDAKGNSVKALKMILDTLTEQGVELLPLNEDVTPIQQVKSSSSELK
ncbi:polysaccharide deacetylase [Anaerocolumna sp. AGMB13025]|uniref:polysaccharide deacetylase family protein n=1 Tax=Anaerocolumna sp. AGMB13025 TaxID=3039116 RepID=UPI00241F82CA|nr:polysaccharide deacetylase family protein [Anaerocolumna sp. AGMB13025]WFR59945.1 polysaccharide deacetylase [Anaerocolumna sp. AGMB13025]